MKLGQVIQGYEITTRPNNANAGKCLWAFAEKDDREYFIKEFLDPKRPHEGSMGTPEQKRQLFAQCQAFEHRHWSVIERIDPTDLDAGNIVTASDFFHEGSRYFKVTKRLYPADGGEPHTWRPNQLRVLLGTLADSVGLLHRIGVVHADLKPDNVLLHRPDGSDLYTTKLIDFDEAFVSGAPPDPSALSGDDVYGAPECLRYMRGDRAVGPEQLTTAVDMFAFGLLVHVYLTGVLPYFDDRHSSAAAAVVVGEKLVPDRRLHPKLAHVLRGLFALSPGDRPRMAEVQDVIDDGSHLALGEPRPRDLGRIRLNMPKSPRTIEAPKREKAAPERGASRVRINLTGRPVSDRDRHGEEST